MVLLKITGTLMLGCVLMQKEKIDTQMKNTDTILTICNQSNGIEITTQELTL